MKRFLLIAMLGLSLPALAQPIVTGDSDAPVKLEDVVKAHYERKAMLAAQQQEAGEERSRDGKVVKEGKDYHFQRWLWYWQSHTDENGYMVSPIKTYEEWKKFKNPTSQSKGTAGDQSNWSFQGPTTSPGGYAGIGRINAMEFHPTNANTYWVATAGGGLWVTTNNGLNWTSLTDHLLVLGTSDIDVNPQNPNTLYLCTGDRDGSDTYSIGILKSYDGGTTWDTTGLKWNTPQVRLTNCLVINKIDTNSLTVATSMGIYKSYNGGATWSQRQTGHFKQVLYHPTDTAILYASRFEAGGNSAHIFRSKDGGATWTQATVTNLPTNANRITMAVTPANVAIVKAIVAGNNNGLNGIYNSTDTGKTFTRIFGPPSGGSAGCGGDLISGSLTTNLSNVSCGNQGWYDLTIAINPANANHVYVGGVNTYRSTNGGTSWNIVNAWAGLSGVTTVHADKHHHVYHPLVANRLFECNDGGIYYADNPTASSIWQHVTNGMGITQFYRNAVANNATFVLAGAQDNGTKGLQGGVWDDISGGDGMDCQIDHVDSNTFYTGVQNGVIYRYSNVWGYDQISDNIPGQPRGGWITPYVVSPHNHDHLIAGYQDIYFSNDAGSSWMSVTNGPINNNRYLLRIAMTPASDSTIYAVLQNSNKIFYTHNFQPGNIAVFDSLTSPYTGNISDIKVDAKDRNHFWITYSGFNTTKVAEYNSGVWVQMNVGLPNVPVHCVEVDSSIGIVYIGTDVGVFYMDTATSPAWASFNKNLPSIEVADLGINYTSKEIWAATYGRGLWKSIRQVYMPDTTNNTDTTDTTSIISVVPFASGDFKIMPNPSNGRFTAKTTVAGLYGKAASIIVIDNTGRVIWRRTGTIGDNGEMMIDAEVLAKGIYIVQIESEGSLLGRQRLIINK